MPNEDNHCTLPALREVRSHAGPHRHAEDDSCPCPAHGGTKQGPVNAGPWSALLPVLVCALCPACLATYAKLLSVLGVGFSLSESQHLVLLSLAIGCSVGMSSWRSWRTQRVWPLGVALLGAALVSLGHVAGDLHELEWVGVGVLFIGGFSEHARIRRWRWRLARS